MDENVIWIMSFGAVDDNGLKIFVPALRLAEKFAKFAFAFDRIGSEAFDKIIRDIIVNFIRFSMTKIIFDSRPDVVGVSLLSVFIVKTSGNIKSPARQTQG